MRSLNDIMGIDHVIRVKGGEITESDSGVWPHDVYAPEVRIGTDADGQILAVHERIMREDLQRLGWDVENGWSAQWLYHGPIMHSSEYIGGALADYIRETDGYWVAVAAEVYPYDGEEDPEPAGWLLLHRELNTAQYVLTAGGWPDSGAITHRLKTGTPYYTGTLQGYTACGMRLSSVHHRSGDAGTLIDITCKRGGCHE